MHLGQEGKNTSATLMAQKIASSKSFFNNLTNKRRQKQRTRAAGEPQSPCLDKEYLFMFYGFGENYESEAAEPLTANPSAAIPHPTPLFLFQLSEDVGATTALVIKRRRHVCVCVCVSTYLTRTHKHAGRLLSISSAAHLQLSQQATIEDPDCFSDVASVVVREELEEELVE